MPPTCRGKARSRSGLSGWHIGRAQIRDLTAVIEGRAGARFGATMRSLMTQSGHVLQLISGKVGIQLAVLSSKRRKLRPH
jgi:hypothetical protein